MCTENTWTKNISVTNRVSSIRLKLGDLKADTRTLKLNCYIYGQL